MSDFNFTDLKDGNCPKCQGSLTESYAGEHVECENQDCGFKMGAGKFFKMVPSYRTGHWKVKHRKMTEDERMLDIAIL